MHGNLYGTRRSQVEEVRALGKICLLDIDLQGVQRMKDTGLQFHRIGVLPPSLAQLEKRIRWRGDTTEEQLRVRVENAAKEIELVRELVEVCVVNDELEEATREFNEIVLGYYPVIAEQSS